MESSFQGDVLESVRRRIQSTLPDFSTAKRYDRHGDQLICDAPAEIGQALALKETLKQANKRLDETDSRHAENLILIQLLDLVVKFMVRRAAPCGVNPDSVRVCCQGKIKIPRELV